MQDRLALTHAGNLVLGGWIFLSAFIWPHNDLQRLNAVIVGGLAAIFALLATKAPRLRYANAALGAWLFWSAWVFPSLRVGTIYNHMMVGVAMFCLAAIPDFMVTRSHSR